MQKKMMKISKKQIATFMVLSVMMSFAITLQVGCQVFAATGDEIIKNGFNTIYSLIAAIVSSIGSLYLLWGVFEWGQSMNMQDGGAQSMAFKRVAAGLVTTIAPQLIPIIKESVGVAYVGGRKKDARLVARFSQ